jgi:hypothetical protein
MKDTLALRLATERDHDVIIRLIDAAAEWLRTKNTRSVGPAVAEHRRSQPPDSPGP